MSQPFCFPLIEVKWISGRLFLQLLYRGLTLRTFLNSRVFYRYSIKPSS